MKLPLYSSLKAKLESKGLDSISSGQMAWFVCSGVLSFIVAFLITLYKLRNLDFDIYFYFFPFILLFFIITFWLILLNFHKLFLCVNIFCYICGLIVGLFTDNFYLSLTIVNIALSIAWLFFIKISLKLRLLFLLVYLCFEILWLIGFLAYGLLEGQISK